MSREWLGRRSEWRDKYHRRVVERGGRWNSRWRVNGYIDEVGGGVDDEMDEVTQACESVLCR